MSLFYMYILEVCMVSELEQEGEVSQTPGQILKAARKAKQLSIGEVAEKLMLGKQIIAAIEDDNYEKISAQVYAEGYLRSYAQILDLSAVEIIDSFRQLKFYSDETEKKPVNPKTCRLSCINNLSSLKLFILVVFVLSVLGLFFVKTIWNKSQIKDLSQKSSSKLVGSDVISDDPVSNDTISTVESYIESDGDKFDAEENFSDYLMLDPPSDLNKKHLK